MKHGICAFCLAILVTAVAIAQEPAHLGFGVSLNPGGISSSSLGMPFMPIGLTNFYLPIDIGDHLRIEPEGGIFSTSREQSSSIPYATGSSSSASVLRLGLGLLYRSSVSEGFRTYGGPRFGMLRSSSSSKSGSGSETTDKETDLVIGLAYGGECFFSQHLSLGGELQINHILFGEPEYSGGGSSGGPTTEMSITTNNALIFLRWYP